MKKFLPVFIICAYCLSACKSPVKEQKDKIYSRHLQRHIELTVVTTPMPDKKEEMNLLLFNNSDFSEGLQAKKIIDSLYTKKMIQPLTMVAYKGENADYGFEEVGGEKGNQYLKFNEFVTDELYPFAKKKAVIRKFNSVAICGFGPSAFSAFDMAFNHDGKIQSAGLFYPLFTRDGPTDTAAFQIIRSLRERPKIRLWLLAADGDSNSVKLRNIIYEKQGITECVMVTLPPFSNRQRLQITHDDFAAFLIWAFPYSY